MRKILVILIIIISNLIGCDRNATESETKPFISTLWQLESIQITSIYNIIPPDDQNYSIKFSPDNSYEGYSACNEINGIYEIHSGSSITIKTLGTTYKYCGPNTINKEYEHGIQDVHSYSIRNTKLYLNFGENSKMVFNAK